MTLYDNYCMAFQVPKLHSDDMSSMPSTSLDAPEVAQLGSQLRVTTELRQPAQRLGSHMRP